MLIDHHQTQTNDVLAKAEKTTAVPVGVNKPAAPWSNPATQPKIMMVDDEKLNILVVAEHLKSDGYRDLVYTNDPSQALSLAIGERPTSSSSTCTCRS